MFVNQPIGVRRSTSNPLLQPEAFCAKHKLPPPQRASARLVPAKDIFLKLATMAAFP